MIDLLKIGRNAGNYRIITPEVKYYQYVLRESNSNKKWKIAYEYHLPLIYYHQLMIKKSKSDYLFIW